ncbi:thioredoxin-like protein [Epithele typhae]|uniref:thioredoxin-like protein n=1 Tax=Epithele typhae TaxID=378194 RepID=UPI0020082634|nr:thioredoxin-like protein [Epithele typhae]KAH9911267.1 thioredoxin-like protein [Epithele typhae]
MVSESKKIILYAGMSDSSHFSQRIHLALEHAHADYTICKVDVRPPREPWYAARINRLGKIPAIAYDSHAILEFLADAGFADGFRSTFLGALPRALLAESASVQEDLPGTGWVAGGWRMAEMVAGLHVYKRVRVCVQEIAAHPTFMAPFTEAYNAAVWSNHPLLQRDQ